MSHTVMLYDCMELMQRLARKTRIQHGVGNDTVIFPYLEQDYGIKIIYDPRALLKPVDAPSDSYVVFASEADYTFLSLKYL